MPALGHRIPIADRFWPKVDLTEGCWLWTGAKSRGYGQLYDGARMRQAHTLSYEMHVGPVPDGLQLDHLCRVRHCVNPAHLEPVTCRENLLRGDTPSARNLAKTHCPQGHPYDEPNTQRKPDGRRACRACSREYQRQRRVAA